MMIVETGQTYTAYNQGRNITPTVCDVYVVWVNDDTVWYKLPFSQQIVQTPIERFKEICKL